MPRLTTPAAEAPAPTAPADQGRFQAPADLAREVAAVLSAMTYPERLRAYRGGVFSPHELSIAAAWLPQELPILNGEWEWISATLADLLD